MIKIKKLKALSLIELMMTISVLSVLLCMGLMSFDEINNLQKVSNAQSQLGDAISKTRSYAKRFGVKSSITANVGASTYSLSDTDGNFKTDATRYDSLSGQLPDGVKVLSSTCGTINFYIDGSVIDDSDSRVSENCSITVGTSDIVKRTITLKALSGEVAYE